jgi:hypothetical protein
MTVAGPFQWARPQTLPEGAAPGLNLNITTSTSFESDYGTWSHTAVAEDISIVQVNAHGPCRRTV